MTDHDIVHAGPDSDSDVDARRRRALIEIQDVIGEIVRQAPRVRRAVISRIDVGLDGPSALLLGQLARAESPLTLSDLADRLDLALSAVSRTAQRLESEGMLVRSAHPTDGRIVLHQLSTSGRTATRAYSTAWHDTLSDILTGWSLDELELLEDLVRRYGTALKSVVSR